MKLENKKKLAARTLKVGKGRIVFNRGQLPEIKEAITRQDIRDLVKAKAIIVDEIKGKKKIKPRKTRRREGSIKKTVNTRKRDYMSITRKLRGFLFELRKKGIVKGEDYNKLRREIRAKEFRSKAQFKERVSNLHKEKEGIK